MNSNRLTYPEYIILILVLVHLLIGINSYFTNPSFFERFIVEDGYIENATAFSLLLISVVLGTAALKSAGWKRIVLGLGTLLFIFGSGEEISWGQRILGYETPDELMTANTQGEFNLHNMQVQGIKLNKLIFSTVMYTGIFCYFILLPLVYRYSASFRSLKYLFIPVPKLSWGMLYAASFLLLLIIPDNKLWELQEFSFAAFLFTSILYQQNPTFDVLLHGPQPGYRLAGH